MPGVGTCSVGYCKYIAEVAALRCRAYELRISVLVVIQDTVPRSVEVDPVVTDVTMKRCEVLALFLEVKRQAFVTPAALIGAAGHLSSCSRPGRTSLFPQRGRLSHSTTTRPAQVSDIVRHHYTSVHRIRPFSRRCTGHPRMSASNTA